MTVTADIKKELLTMGISASCKKIKSGKLSKVVANVKADSFQTLVEKEQELLNKGYSFELYGAVKPVVIIPALPSELKEIYSVDLTIFAAY